MRWPGIQDGKTVQGLLKFCSLRTDVSRALALSRQQKLFLQIKYTFVGETRRTARKKYILQILNFDRKSFRWAMCVKPALLQRGFFCFRSSQLEVWGQICWSIFLLASFFSRARARACPPAPVKPRLRQKASTPAPSHITGKKAADEGKGGGSGFVGEEGAMLLLGRIFWGGGSAGTRESLFATDQEIDWICTEASLDDTQILTTRPPGFWLIGESYSNKIYSLQKLICLFVT